MKFRLIKSLLILSVGAFMAVSCDTTHPGFRKNENGIYYQIISNVDSTKNVKADSGMIFQLTMSYGSKDSLLFDAKQNARAFELPYAEPTYKGDINEALGMFAKGDSAVFIIKADSFFIKTAHSPEVPELFKANNDLYFWVKIVDIVSLEQLNAKRQAELDVLKEKEMVDLNSFMSRNYPTAMATETGLYIIKTKAGSGKAPKDGDMLNFDFTVATINGPQLYSSMETGRPIDHEKGKPFDTEGFTEGLNTLTPGDEVTLIVPSKLAFKAQGRQGMIMPFTTMLYTVKLNSVKSKEQYEKEVAAKKAQEQAQNDKLKNQEKVTMANYISKNKITVQPTPSGLYYIETAAGTGEQAVAGDKVKVHYSGTLLDGTKFDASYDRGEPYEFTLGRNEVVKGWDEGIAMMKKGGKATLIVPSSLAYGERARGAVIHAFAPLKFDVELVDVTKATK